jgi:hypothetical protein
LVLVLVLVLVLALESVVVWLVLECWRVCAGRGGGECEGD